MEINDTIIVKVLAGEASDEEIRALDDWKSLNIENQKKFDQTKSIWDKAVVAGDHVYDVDVAWNKVKAQTVSPVKVVAVWQRPIFKMAAAIVLCLAIYWLVDVGTGGLNNSGLQEIAAITPTDHLLPDGSKVSLAKGSVLRYHLPFGEKGVREVEVIGEASVHVENNEKALFRVKTNLAKIESRSSSFELSKNNNGQDDVIVHRGTLKVSTLNTGEQSRSFNNTVKSVVVTLGEKVSLSTTDHQKILLVKNPVDWYNDVENQMFVFNTLPLKECVIILMKHFKKQIVIDQQLNDCQVHFSVMYNDLATGLSNLSHQLGGELINENGFEISVPVGEEFECE